MKAYRARTLVLLFSLSLAGCVGEPTRPSEFFVLSAQPAPPVSGLPAQPLSLGLGPVTLPDIFDRPQIVTRRADNQIDLSEFHRWAGDLNRDLNRALQQNLMSRLDTDRVVPFPWSSRAEPDFQITLRFFRFEGRLDGAVHLEGVWRLLDGDKGCEITAHQFDLSEAVAAADYASYAAAISRAVAALSDQIARGVSAAQPGC